MGRSLSLQFLAAARMGGALLLSATTLVLAQSAPTAAVRGPVAAADWPSYNRTVAGDRFSPLTEIDRSNVGGLRVICEYRLPEVTSLQTGPIVVDGMMYFTTDTISYAIDAGSCAEKWKQVRPSATPSYLGVNRGFAYMDGTLFRGTSDVHVIALDARDGHTIWDKPLEIQGKGMSVPMAPIASGGRVFVGNAGGDIPGLTGHVYALDARDGNTIWRFDVVPDSGPVRATWRNAPGFPITGGGLWTSLTLDEPNGVLYVPAGNPAPDFEISVRPGQNLYTSSLIALDATTGRVLAYNQLVPRDIHDWDVDTPPALITSRGGRMLVASSNKDGMLSVLDRKGLTRAAIAASGARAGGAIGAELPLLYQKPTTTRLNVDVPLSRDHPTKFCPGILGGSEWNGAAFSPAANTIFAGAVDWCATAQLKKTPERGTPGQFWFGATKPSSELMDPKEAARGWVTAFDAENGAVRWKHQTPRPVLGGVTPTAGGIVFSGDVGGNVFAFDAETGRVLWQTSTGQSTGGGVMTYSAGGHQRLAIAAGMKSPLWPGATQSSRIIVYGLR
ncbi:MAG TPA: PQQ-binding-like beta-propeller repeat protein [Gemmatimonadaceae bacterium]